MALHLVVVILFQRSTNCAIHIPGKLVPQIINFLCSHVDKEQYKQLTSFEHLLIEQRRRFAQQESTYGKNDYVMAMSTQNTAVSLPGMVDTTQIEQLLGLLDSLKQIVLKPKV